MFGYQYSEILRSLMCVYLCGGSCIEDVTTHLMKHLSLHPTLRTCSADTILRAIEELTFKSITYKSASGKFYDFNTADKINCLLVNAQLATGQLKSGQEYDLFSDYARICACFSSFFPILFPVAPLFLPDFRKVAGRWRGKFGIGEGKY